MGNPGVLTVQPVLYLSPGSTDRRGQLKNPGISYDPEKPERRLPGQADPPWLAQLRVDPGAGRFVAGRGGVPRVDQQIDVYQDHLFVRFAFRLRQYFPRVVEIWKITLSQ